MGLIDLYLDLLYVTTVCIYVNELIVCGMQLKSSSGSVCLSILGVSEVTVLLGYDHA
jgi:hypothetical protein